MPQSGTGPAPDDLLNPKEASAVVTLTVGYLAKLRRESLGPPWIKIGKRVVRYRRADLLAWLAQHERSTTTQ